MLSTVETKTTLPKKYSVPPILSGYTYEPEDAYRARDEGRLLAIRVETNTSCNLRCRYCYAESGAARREVPLEKLKAAIDQAAQLGLESVVVIGGGEPTLYSGFRELISYIHLRGIIPVVFSNTMAMDRELAEFLYSQDASVMGKLDSLRDPVQDFLGGLDGAAKRIRTGLQNLLDVGFGNPEDPHRLRLGVSFVTNRANLMEIEDIWHFCRSNNIFPNMEILTPTGRALETLDGYALELDQIREYKLRLLEADRKTYGHEWLPYTPLTGSGCLQHLYSLYITMDGDVRPCAPTKFDQHPDLMDNGVYPYNVYRMTIPDIFKSELFQYVRHIDKNLRGKCRACEHHPVCIGCRGYAYSVGINEGMNPYDALSLECRQCFRPMEEDNAKAN